MSDPPFQQIRAVQDVGTIRVYQAYNDAIADAALAGGTFVSPPFKMERMTWVKPSFLWMMYRSGWARKDDGQRRILALDLTREGFDWALRHSCPSHRDPGMSDADWAALKARCPVRIQWDPERGLHLEPLAYRAIQMGLSGEAVTRLVSGWIRRIEDVTPLAHDIHAHVLRGDEEGACALLPVETPYTPAA